MRRRRKYTNKEWARIEERRLVELMQEDAKQLTRDPDACDLALAIISLKCGAALIQRYHEKEPV